MGNLSNLTAFWIQNNQLSGVLPSFSKVNLHPDPEFYIYGNRFLFSGIEDLVKDHGNDSSLVIYKPQASIPIHESGSNLSVSAGGTLSNNTYKWYKGSSLVATNVGDSTFAVQTAGQYSVSVTNALATQLTLYSDTEFAGTLQSDSLALIDLYNSTNGAKWSFHNWNLQTPVNSWYGITETNGRITKVDVSGNNLVGIIPSSVGNLTQLDTLDLGDNYQLTGTLPSSIGNLTNLIYFEILTTKISGSIPFSFGNLTKLQSLILGDALLSDSIPASLSKFPDLKKLIVAINAFTFAGMEDLVKAYSFLLYNPQAQVPLHNNGGKLSVSVYGTLSNNTYKWYNGNTLVAMITGDSTYVPTTGGYYSVAVSNSIAKELTLYSDTVLTGSLPVKLLSFTAIKQNSNALLQWTTAQEVNTSYFEVERSTDNLHFLDISKVNAKESLVANNYVFTDNTLSTLSHQSPTVYYRLKMYDKDGSYVLSEIRNINLSSVFTATIYPNPVKDKLSISTSASKDEAAQIEIISTEGKILLHQSLNLSSGTSTQTIDVARLAKGNYIINIKTKETSTSEKFVKE